MINYLLLFSFFIASTNRSADWFLKEHLDSITSDRPVELASGIVSTSAIEYNTSVSYAEEALYFSTNKSDWSKSSIMVSAYKDGQFTKPSRVMFGGNDYDAGDVHISADGQYLYFSGKNINNRSDGNIYRCQKTDSGWSAPEILPKAINSESQEAYPMTTASGNLYFGRLTNGSSYDIYVSKYVNGKYLEAERLPETINSTRLDLDAWVSPDESYMIFVSKDDPNGFGVTDMYISFQKDGKWSKARSMGERYNSNGVDGSPCVSKDGQYLFFTSTRDSLDPRRFDGALDIYVAKFDVSEWKRN
jgi:Tol biopolymer transport system component